MRTLYHTPLSPACRKVRMLLKEKDLLFELEVENYWERREDFNPACDVPVLVDEGGDLVSGPYAICEYLEEKYPERNLIGASIEERREVRRLISWFDEKFLYEVTLNLLHEKVFKRLMGYGTPNSEAIRAGKANISYHLDYIAHLTRKQGWLAAERMTLADLTAAAHLSCLDYMGDVDWQSHPEVHTWYAIIKSRPCFRPLLTDRISGMKPAPHYENLDF
ncbi:MAG: glutathione S-transferase family protein [Alphaproteobacteria bacterium]|nr:glutathione S-transferase family protein [Alphaproteobacteria bacterium]